MIYFYDCPPLLFGTAIIIYGACGIAPKRNVFLAKTFADPIIANSKFLLTQPQIAIKK
jgi:hypothetical protein